MGFQLVGLALQLGVITGMLIWIASKLDKIIDLLKQNSSEEPQ